jgi:predicted hydrolase (HD superfamily)
MISKKEAWKLLTEYNQEEFHLKHARTVAQCMRIFAIQNGYEEEKDLWEIVGLLHDIDFEKYPLLHCKKAKEILEERNIDPRIIHAVISHGYGICSDVKPEHTMEKVLYAIDELTGLIGAASLMRPSKSYQDMNLKSVKKKFKDKGFAAGCDRDVIRTGAEFLNLELDELLNQTLNALKECEMDIQNDSYYL